MSSDGLLSDGQQLSVAAAGSAGIKQAWDTPLKQKSNKASTNREIMRINEFDI